MYSGTHVIGCFISHKVNKIRWLFEEYIECNSFVTGSWDSSHNHISLWSFKGNTEDAELTPHEDATLKFPGDVTELLFLKNNSEHFVASSTNGFVSQYRVSRLPDAPARIVEVQCWEGLHKWENESAACTAVDIYDGDIVTVGEDGRINLLTAGQKQIVHAIDEADSCSLTCVCFLKHNEILTGNLRGQMRSWDIRCSKEDAQSASNFMRRGDQSATTCITHHPTQRHLVLAGSDDGSVAVWDLRLASYPVSVWSAHQDAITELRFHPDRPSKLFSSAYNGELYLWDGEKLGGTEGGMAWLNTETSKQKLQVHTLISGVHLPINSMDLNGDRLVCGCDNEAIYLMNNLLL